MKHIPELDGVRAVAIIAVLLFHYNLGTGIVHGGYLGVDVFFVLSGFLITSLLVAEERRTGRVSLPDFYRRRARRILPPLFATIALALLLLPPNPWEALASLGFYMNFFTGTKAGLLHTWSLSIEEQFYIAWPLVFIAFPRHRTRILLAAVGFALVFRLVAGWAIKDTGLAELAMARYTPARIDGLALGCLAALHFRAFLLSRPLSLACMVAMGVLMAFDARLFVHGWGYTMFSIAAAVSMVAILDGRHPLIASALRSKVMRYLGTRSYGLYLYHWPIIIYFGPAVPGLLKFAAAMLVTELSYRTVEAYFRAPRAAASAGGRLPLDSCAETAGER